MVPNRALVGPPQLKPPFFANYLLSFINCILFTTHATTYLTRIGIWGTTPHRLERLKEGSAMTQPTIQKILEDHDVLPKVKIIISIKIYVKYESRDKVLIGIML
jgi:hypothetical protein